MTDELARQIKISSRYLNNLPHVSRVVTFLQGNNLETFDKLIYGTCNQLIAQFNNVGQDDIAFYLPGIQALKQKLGDQKLPYLEEMSPWDFYGALHKATPLMERGQAIRRRSFHGSAEEIQEAIGTPSMDTSDMALALGTAAHIIERSIMQYMQKRGITEWKKDDVLFALEEVAMLLHLCDEESDMHDATFFDLITTPNNEGGLGWRSRTDLQKFEEQLIDLDKTHSSQLTLG